MPVNNILQVTHIMIQETGASNDIDYPYEIHCGLVEPYDDIELGTHWLR